MATVRRSQTAITVLGTIFLLTGVIFAFLYLEFDLKHGNLGSRPDWVDPPTTSFDRIILHFPIGWFLIIGAALLIIALIRTAASVLRRS